MSTCNVEAYYTPGTRKPKPQPCPFNGRDYHGRCLGACRECDEHLLSTGRYTTYCPSCDTCPTCGCPRVDGFTHYADCTESEV
jgi:hypothetical protein